nr:MAG: replication associated protein [Cressdnaviricota sp.]
MTDKTESKRGTRRFTFTFNNYTEDEAAGLVNRFRELKLIGIISKEVGASGTPHLQGYVEFKDAKSFKTVKEKILTNKCHILKAEGNIDENLHYCRKDRPQDDKLSDIIYENMPEELCAKARALKKVRTDNLTKERKLTPQEIFKKQLIDERLKDYKDVKWKPWQQEILNIISGKPDNRAIYWYWCEKGNSGKSFVSDYITLTRNVILGDGKSNDVIYQIASMVENLIKPEIVLIDIPRNNTKKIPYGTLEKIKNGIIFSGKYESIKVVIPKPHVIIFANKPPDINEMSADRWRIVCVDEIDTPFETRLNNMIEDNVLALTPGGE